MHKVKLLDIIFVIMSFLYSKAHFVPAFYYLVFLKKFTNKNTIFINVRRICFHFGDEST